MSSKLIYLGYKLKFSRKTPLFFGLKNYINTYKFSLILKKTFKAKNLDEENKSFIELIELASEERGILFKLIQQLYPDKITETKKVKQVLSKDKVISIIENELKIKFNEHFSSISDSLSSASIGQIHKAVLKSGTNAGQLVAIKIQYPDVEKSLKTQMKILKLAAFSSKISPIAKWNIAASSIVAQVENRINEELDYQHELKNLIHFQNCNTNTQIKKLIPFESYSTSKILTQSWIEGVDLNYIKKNWDNKKRKLVAEKIVDGFLEQIFINGFFQGDTNFSNFILQDSDEINLDINVQWIDFGNWSQLSSELQESIYALISQTIQGEEINYLGHFERIGFDLKKLHYFQNVLPNLVAILFDPFLIDRPFDLANWNIEKRIDNLLGENKWWFRSSGDAHFLELMKSFYGIINLLRFLEVNINWQKTFLKNTAAFNIDLINQKTKRYENNIPSINKMAKCLVVQILKNSIEHVKIELPATALLDLESFIPDDIKQKLIDKSFDLKLLKFKHLEKGLVPGEIFNLETFDYSDSSNEKYSTNFKVYLT